MDRMRSALGHRSGAMFALLCCTYGCAPSWARSISPACRGLEVSATHEMLDSDSPLRRALAFIPEVPRSLRGGWVQRSLEGVPQSDGYGDFVPKPPQDARVCLAHLPAPLFRLAWYPQATANSDDQAWTTSWAGRGIGERPYLGCLAHQYESEISHGEILPAPGSPGFAILPRALNGGVSDPAYHAVGPALLFDMRGNNRMRTLDETPPQRSGALDPVLLSLLRKVDVTVDGFEVFHRVVVPEEGQSIARVQTMTLHYKFVDVDHVRACYLYEFTEAWEASAAARSIDLMLDLLADWDSQKPSRSQVPNQSLVIAPRRTHLHAAGRQAGLEAVIPLDDLEKLGSVLDSAVTTAGEPHADDDDLRRENRESIWQMFQPRAGLDYE